MIKMASKFVCEIPAGTELTYQGKVIGTVVSSQMLSNGFYNVVFELSDSEEFKNLMKTDPLSMGIAEQ